MVTDVDRRRLVNAFQSNQDWLTLASNLNIKRQFRRTGVTDAARKGGNRPKKIDDEMVAYLIRCVEVKPTITLKGINKRMKQHLPDKPHVTHQIISITLDGSLITIKDI